MPSFAPLAAESRLKALADRLFHLPARRRRPEEIARVLQGRTVGLGAALDEDLRRMYWSQGLAYHLPWTPVLIDRWRRIVGLNAAEFFRTSPIILGPERGAYSLYVEWRRTGRRLLWHGGGLAFDTFAGPSPNPMTVMPMLYPDGDCPSAHRDFSKVPGLTLPHEALALWAFGPQPQADLAIAALRRIPASCWSPLVRGLIRTGAKSLTRPTGIRTLLHRLPLLDRLEVAQGTRYLLRWAPFIVRTLRKCSTKGPGKLTRFEKGRAAAPVVDLTFTAHGHARSDMIAAAGWEAILAFGSLAVPRILDRLDSAPPHSVSADLLGRLLGHPEEEVRARALRCLGSTPAEYR